MLVFITAYKSKTLRIKQDFKNKIQYAELNRILRIKILNML